GEGVETGRAGGETRGRLDDVEGGGREGAVVGGGDIGLEGAENFAALGEEVTLIQRGPQLANIFDEDMAELVHREAKKQGIHLILNETVEGFEGEHRVQTVQTDKQNYETDFVLIGIGVIPNTEFLKSTGIYLNEKGAIYVNSFQETNVKNIYAAGDCATNFHRVKQINDHIPLGTTANK